MNCSKILVLSEGELVEYDTPSKLLARSHSHFRTMVENAEKGNYDD